MKGFVGTQGQIEAKYESMLPIFEESELLHKSPLLHQALQ